MHAGLRWNLHCIGKKSKKYANRPFLWDGLFGMLTCADMCTVGRLLLHLYLQADLLQRGLSSSGHTG